MKNFTLTGIFCIGLFTFSCSSDKVKSDTTFYFVTYDDVKDWDPATAFSLEVVPMSNIYEPLLWYEDSNGKTLPSGLYFITISDEIKTDVKKALLIH